MATQADQIRSLTAASAISAFSRITIDSSGKAAIATNDDLAVGVVQADAASGDVCAVRLFHPTFQMVANMAITAGSQVYPTTNGQISGSAVGTEIGLAVEAATAARDVIEIAILLN